MAKRDLHTKALRLRKQGMSYSQIKEMLGVHKSTLSVWLRDYPLSAQQLHELRDVNPIRIEKYRATRKRQKEERLKRAYKKVKEDFGYLTDRELMLCGFFLYWGEGTKTQYGTISLSNTDPAAILMFKRWLHLLGVPEQRMRVRLHLYSDMCSEAEHAYWSAALKLPASAFRKPYIKSSNQLGITQTKRFTHGTCNLMYENSILGNYVHMGLKVLQEIFAGDSQI